MISEQELNTHHYVKSVLRISDSKSSEDVRIPEVGTGMDKEHLALALEDPMVLLKNQKSDENVITELMHFARWLDNADSNFIPKELFSKSARFSFLVWTLPLRMESLPEVGLAASGPLGQMSSGKKTLQQCARNARDCWLTILSSWEDDPWLAIRGEGKDWIESELKAISWIHPKNISTELAQKMKKDELLVLGSKSDDVNSSLNKMEHERISVKIAEEHWLPRGAVWEATRIQFSSKRDSVLALLIGPLTALSLITLFFTNRFHCIAALIPLAIFAVSLGFYFGEKWFKISLLRIPATIAVGLALLISLTPRWWKSEDGWILGAVLLVIALCYIIFECHSHGSSLPKAAGRGLAVWGIATLYAAALSIPVLVYVVPQIGEAGNCLNNPGTSVWESREVSDACQEPDMPAEMMAAPAKVVLLMTGWSLTAGLIVQIMWQDMPITAPLGRVRRSRGSR
ncbi:MAG: hypothetical protein ACRCSF_03010 [Mycobacteriaceae bacterium]